MRSDYCPIANEPCQSLCDTPCSTQKRYTTDAMKVRQAVAQAVAQQEPVECMCGICKLGPPQRTWHGLTDDEVRTIIDAHTTDDHGYDIWCDVVGVSQVIQSKLKEKNT